MSKLLEKKKGQKYIDLIISVVDKKNNDADIPMVRLYFE